MPPRESAYVLPPEAIHFEAAGFDPSQPGHVLRVPLKDGRALVVHMNSETAAQLRLEHESSALPCKRFCCAQARHFATRGAA